MNKILITLNREIFEEYYKHYFTQNPRARIFPFLTNGKTQKFLYSVLSLNDLLPINSMAYGSKKEKWGDFGIWVAKKYKTDEMKIQNSIIELRLFSETKAKKDADNIAGGYKLFGDGFAVQSGMFIDDNYNHINPLIIACDYDKENPRLEIRITTFTDEVKFDDIYKKMELHLLNWK